MWRLIAIVAAISIFTGSLSGVVTGLAIKSSIDSSNHSQAVRLHAAQIAGCYRQNVRTVAANKNAKATYDLNVLFAGAVATPQPHASRKERALTVRFHARLVDVVSTLTWTPVVQHCSQAPTTVELPVAFSERQPPNVDLRLSPAITGIR